MSEATVALEGAGCVLAGMVTASVDYQTLIHIITATPIRVETVASPAVAFVTPGVVRTVLLAARASRLALVQVHTCPEVIVQMVTMVTAADRSEGGVLALLGTASIGSLTTIHNLHLDTIAFPAVGTQLVCWVTDTGKGTLGVMATVGTGSLACLTLIDVFTVFAILCQCISRTTVTLRSPSFISTGVHTASISVCTGVSQLAVFAVLCKMIVGSTATLVVSRGQLHTVLLTASISDSTGVDGDACPAICVQAGAWVAFAVERTSGVDTSVLAASVVDLTLVNICTFHVSCVVAIVSIEAGVAVPALVAVSARPIISSPTWA